MEEERKSERENQTEFPTVPEPVNSQETIPSFGQNPDFNRTENTVFEELKRRTEASAEKTDSSSGSAEAAKPSVIRNPAFTPEGIPVSGKKKERKAAVLVLAVIVSLVGLVLFVSGLFLAAHSSESGSPEREIGESRPGKDQNAGGQSVDIPQNPENSVSVPPSVDFSVSTPQNTQLTTKQVIQKVEPSVVMIRATVSSGTFLSGESMGSGVILSENGQILTNAHIVANAESISVQLKDGTEYRAEILGADSVSDIAVLQIDAAGLPAAEFGDSSLLEKGDEVIAIGHPYSDKLAYSATKGIVSNMHQNFRFESLGSVLDLIQHDATINMGNSGGPLVNMYGQVVGINSVKISGNSFENICFAIQINSALEIAGDLIRQGAVVRPVIGVQCQTDSSVGGALVVKVAPNGPAEQAGILPGDIITKLNGERLRSTEEFVSLVSAFQPGDSVKISVLRDTDVFEFEVTLTAGNKINYDEKTVG